METTGKPGRPSRAETLQRDRRRRTDASGMPRKLAVTGDLDRAGYEYRWINDADARLHMKTQQDDWNIVSQEGGELKPDASDYSGATRALVGSKKDGSPMYSYLCRKPKELAKIDRAAKDARLDEIENQIKRGAPASVPEANGPEFYKPSGTVLR